jgi:hypothetical protein
MQSITIKRRSEGFGLIAKFEFKNSTPPPHKNVIINYINAKELGG